MKVEKKMSFIKITFLALSLLTSLNASESENFVVAIKDLSNGNSLFDLGKVVSKVEGSGNYRIELEYLLSKIEAEPLNSDSSFVASMAMEEIATNILYRVLLRQSDIATASELFQALKEKRFSETEYLQHLCIKAGLEVEVVSKSRKDIMNEIVKIESVLTERASSNTSFKLDASLYPAIFSEEIPLVISRIMIVRGYHQYLIEKLLAVANNDGSLTNNLDELQTKIKQLSKSDESSSLLVDKPHYVMFRQLQSIFIDYGN